MHMTQHHLHKIKTQHRKYTKRSRLNPWVPIREGEWEGCTEEKGMNAGAGTCTDRR